MKTHYITTKIVSVSGLFFTFTNFYLATQKIKGLSHDQMIVGGSIDVS